ncbi:MAG: type I secretion system permease/ATPase [Campylobacterota bacterium]|nr:type I secretion system permease/ATPase [Campylobacterota bacterium]
MLIREDNTAVIVDSINDDKASILLASSGDNIYEVSLEELEKNYSGYLILLSKKFQYYSKNSKTLTKQKHWFWDSLKLSKDIYIDVIKASLIINFFVLSVPLFSMNVYDRVIPNNAIDTLWVLAIGVIVVLVFDGILKFMRTYFIETAGKKSDILISSKLFEHVMGLRSEVSPISIGSFATHFKEFDAIRNFLTSSVLTLVIDIPFLIIFLVVIFYIGGIIVLVPAIVMAIILLYTFVVAKPLYKSIEETYQASAKKNSILIETLQGLETIKVFNNFNTTQYNYEEANAYIANKNIKTKILSTSITTVTGVLIQLNTVLVIIVGSYLIQDLQMSMGALIAVVILSSRTISPIGQVASLVSTYEQTKIAYNTLDEIMSKEIEREDAKEFIQLNEIKGLIEFKNVTFTYPNDTKESLKNISFKIEANQRYAILGKIGSGKSTILKLILGLYKPQSGSVLIDGIDINQIDPITLRDNISYVSQDIILFEGSLKDNISYGSNYIDDESILEAVKVSNLDEYIKSLPQGFDTHIVEGGKNLSGGQRQSIAIARAFLKNKTMVLLDEPTNTMDSATEKIIQNNLKQKVENKTTLLVTHKLSMLELVDNVIVIDAGSITFNGAKSDIGRLK